MTAEEFLKKEQIDNNTVYNYDGEDVGYISDIMIEFAKFHVKAALEAADKLAENEFSDDAWELIDNKNLILNAYPEELIK